MEGRLISYIGKRSIQEDFGIASPNYSISIVCDGMGGRPDGKEASNFIGKAVFQSLINCNRKDWAIELTAILIKADKALKTHIMQNNYSILASTTIAVLVLFEDYGLAAHIGDNIFCFVMWCGKEIGRWKLHNSGIVGKQHHLHLVTKFMCFASHR